MSDSLKPLLHEGADEFERALLRSGSDVEPPPPGARERSMSALGLSSAAPSASSPSATAPSGLLVGLVLATLIAGGMVIGVSWRSGGAPDGASKSASTGVPPNESAMKTAHEGLAFSGEQPTPPSVAEPTAGPSITPNALPNALPNTRPPRTPAVASARRAVEPAATPARAESVPTPVGRTARVDDDSLTRETLLIDEARRAVASGDATRALGLLDAHDRDFSPAAFALDADVLRIEALERAGRSGDADRLAQAFLTRHIEGSYARRVQAVRDRIREARASAH